MTPTKSLARVAAIASAAVTLAACVTVFPSDEPVQMYRFGDEAALGDQKAETSAAPAADQVGLFKGRTTFAQAVGTDRILTIKGAEAAYIGSARWVSPASVLFDEALAQAFDDNTGPARLVVRGEISRAAYFLRLDVRNFEAVYDHGSRAAPTIVVRVRAVLTRSADRTLTGDQVFETKVRASSNRVGSIVQAFDQATAQTIGELVAWANETAVRPDAG